MFWFVLGVFATMYAFVIIFRDKVKSHSDDDIVSTKFYLNIFFLNTKDVLQNIVRSKISRNAPVLRAVTKRLIVHLVNDEKLSSKIGLDLCTTIPGRLEVLGISTNASVVYQQESFICIEVEISDLNVRKFLEKSTRGLSASNLYSRLCDFLGDKFSIEHFIKKLLTGILCKKLMSSLPVTIVEKLQLKLTAEIELITCSESEQGPFLISTMQELNVKVSSKKTKSSQLDQDM